MMTFQISNSKMNADNIETSGTGKISRMYYRNNFFHIGHLKTLYDNERIARKNKGICYAIIDDRQDMGRIDSIQEDFDFLALTHIKTVSVKREHQRIINYTLNLVQEGHVYIYHCDEKITNIERIYKADRKSTRLNSSHSLFK